MWPGFKGRAVPSQSGSVMVCLIAEGWKLYGDVPISPTLGFNISLQLFKSLDESKLSTAGHVSYLCSFVDDETL